MAVRRLVKVLEEFFFKDRLLSKNGLRMAVRRLVKALEKNFFLTTTTFQKWPENGCKTLS